MPAERTTDEFLSLPEVEKLARERFPVDVWEYIESGAADEITVRWNSEAYRRIRLRPSVLRGVSTPDTSIDLLGHSLPHPILLAPTAYQGAFHPRGELAVAEAAGAAGAVYVLSTATTTRLEDVADRASAPLWFQLYVQSDRDFTDTLVRQAEAAGYAALVVTVDTPVLGARNRQQRASFRIPPGVGTPYLSDLNTGKRTLNTTGPVTLAWPDLERFVATCRIPVLLKGIMTGEDARRAIDVGVGGVIVSNHGGRNLDTLPATIEALPEVATAVDGRVPVLVDGGIRRGTDVLKAIALGATAVLIGRPYVYGLGVAGAAGVRRVLDILRNELELAMVLCGTGSISEIDHRVLWHAHPTSEPPRS